MNYKNVSVSLENEQVEFVKNQSKWFNFSKFVRYCLDEYIKYLGVLKNDKERINKTRD